MLVDRMPESASRGGVLSVGGCLLPGGSGPGRGVWYGGCVSAPGGGVCGIPACTEAHTPCEQNDRQV